ncbi:MAG: NAD(P)H-dependent oxidoreductase [Eubacterium sp.]|nr:NAD(P)H-dependent oxidoreductase [Eubacterium sp.]
MSKLTAYFSASGNTAQKAKAFAEANGTDIYEIKPEAPYSPADVKWTNPLARCNKEWIKKTRPTLSDKDAKIESYDTVYLFFPIWYFTAPLIIRGFLEAYDFSGKKVVLFATSGGSEFGKTAQHLRESAPNADIIEGEVLNGTYSEDDYKKLV